MGIRDFGPGRMDYERCAALHKELLTRAVIAKGGSMTPAPLSWWEARAPPPEVADALHPSLIEFLKRAWDEDVLLKPLFVFIGALKLPEGSSKLTTGTALVMDSRWGCAIAIMNMRTRSFMMTRGFCIRLD
ncbi:hypothetical protein BDW75DRAFT_245548 [Aspergillus navahoensis]